MSNRTIKVRPGMLVTLSTAIRGGVTYDRDDLAEERRPDGAEIEEWRTTKVTADPEEHEEAVRVRSRVRSLVKSACVTTPFGFVCPADNIPDLDAALEEAERIVRDFNAGATHCEVRFASLRGEIAENARDAIEAVRSEVGELLRDMERALELGQVKNFRDVATRATQMHKLLEQESAGSDRLTRAIREGRKVARMIVKQVEKGSSSLADVLSEADMSPISEARFLFLEGPDEEPVDPETGEVLDLSTGPGERLPHVVLPPGTAVTVPIEYEDEEEAPEPEDDSPPAVDADRYAGILDPGPVSEPGADEDDEIEF